MTLSRGFPLLLCLVVCKSWASSAPNLNEYLQVFGSSRQSDEPLGRVSGEVRPSVPPEQNNMNTLISATDISRPAEELIDDVGLSDNELRMAREPSIDELDSQKAAEGVALIEQGQFPAAKKVLEAYLSKHPGAHQTRKTLATLLMAQGESEESQRVVDEGLGLAPNFAPFKKLSARHWINVSPGRVVSMLEQVPPDLVLDPEYHEIYAVALQMSDQFEAAALVFEALLRMDDSNANWWMGLALCHDALGDTAAAESSYAMSIHFGAGSLVLGQYAEARLKDLRRFR